MLSEDGTQAQLDTPEAIEVVQFAKDMADAAGGQQRFAAFSGSWDIFGEENPIAADQIGGTLFEQWYLGVLAGASPDVDLTVKPFTDRQGEPLTFAGGLAFAVPKGSDSPDAAYAFAEFMSREDTWVKAARASKKEAEQGGGVYTGTYTGHRPADQRIFDEVYEPSGNAAFDDAVKTVLDVQEHAVSVPANAAGAEVKQAWTDAINEVLLGRADAQEAMAKAQQDAQAALDRAQQ